MCLELCETPPPGKGGRDCYISLFAPHATPTSHRNVPLLAKWEIAYRSSELDITVYVQSAGQNFFMCKTWPQPNPQLALRSLNQGSSQRFQGVAGRYALTVDVPVPLRLQKCRYAFNVFILLVFSSGRESIASESQVHKTRRARSREGDVCFSFSTSGSVVCLQVRHTATAVLWGLSRQCQANVSRKKKIL